MRTPDQGLRRYTGYRLRRTTSAAMSRISATLAPFGLRRTTFSTLALVVEHPGLRQSQVAEALAIERPNFVQIVGELEKAGLLERKLARNDRRAYALHVTEAGRALYEKARAQVRACDSQLIEGLTPEQIEALHESLRIMEYNATHFGDT
ncbi:MAG: MarR family transcriptional regulator [Rhodobacteraceae bacterium]|nr:MAG: MarR family transcriptional regulator [Paracoccaceae bacterium]